MNEEHHENMQEKGFEMRRHRDHTYLLSQSLVNCQLQILRREETFRHELTPFIPIDRRWPSIEYGPFSHITTRLYARNCRQLVLLALTCRSSYPIL